MTSGARSDALAWLDERRGEVPDQLHASMARSLRGRDGRPADALLEAAFDLLGGVLNGPEGRESALPLLTADALLTYAFEAAAEDGSIDFAGFSARAAVLSGTGDAVLPPDRGP